MLDQYATGMAMTLALEQHKRRRDLLMFSALPDAPVLPLDPPSRGQRARHRLWSVIRAIGRAPRVDDVVSCRQPVTGSPSTC